MLEVVFADACKVTPNLIASAELNGYEAAISKHAVLFWRNVL